jgi:hypothetical protein
MLDCNGRVRRYSYNSMHLTIANLLGDLITVMIIGAKNKSRGSVLLFLSTSEF